MDPHPGGCWVRDNNVISELCMEMEQLPVGRIEDLNLFRAPVNSMTLRLVNGRMLMRFIDTSPRCIHPRRNSTVEQRMELYGGYGRGKFRCTWLGLFIPIRHTAYIL